LTLSGTSYTQNFDSVGSGLPTGWTVNTNATVSSSGGTNAFDTTITSWSNTADRFKNLASSDGLLVGSSAAAQNASTDRALGIRPSATFGDPSGAFVFTLANTTGFTGFGLSFEFHTLDPVAARTNTWTVDYRIGPTGSFTSIGTVTDGVFGKTNFTGSFGSALNNTNAQVQIRIAALSASTGSGARDVVAIDDYQLTWTAIPEPSTVILVGLGLAGALFMRQRSRV
jgi:hypothetical protein